jgi:peptidyl-prolyl cis-trans isomerase D
MQEPHPTGIDMLQTIRENSKGLIAKVIIGFIIAVMALFGVESIVGGLANNATVAEVNGEEITATELSNSVQNLMMNVGADLASLDDELIREIALGQLIEDRLLRQAANDAGMTISNDAVDLQLINNPQFQISGVFNSDLAVRTMATQGFTVQGYRQALAQQMLVGQLANAYASSTFVTESELDRIAALSNQTRDFRFVSVTLGNRTAGEAIPDDQIEAYYQNNQARFMMEEEVAINYVELNKSDIFSEVAVSDDRVRAQYEQERAAFGSASQRRAAHILLEISGSLSQDDALAQATALKMRLAQGEDFAELALEASSDTLSAQDGGDIGYTDGTAFPAALEAALETLELGAVSDPVVSEFGVHLVKLTEYDVNEFPAFEDVAGRIRRDLSSAEVDGIYFSRLETLANLAFETTDLTDISEELGLPVFASEMFGRLGGNTDVTRNANVIAAAFSDEVLRDRINSDVIEIGNDRAIVINLDAHVEATLQPLEEVRGEIAAILRTVLERERAAELGEQVLAALRAGQAVDELIAENELQWIVQTNASRNQPGLNTEVLQYVFSMPAPENAETSFNGFGLSNGTYIVAELQSVRRGGIADMSAAERDALVSSFIELEGRNAFDSFLANTRQNAEIFTNPNRSAPLF